MNAQRESQYADKARPDLAKLGKEQTPLTDPANCPAIESDDENPAAPKKFVAPLWMSAECIQQHIQMNKTRNYKNQLGWVQRDVPYKSKPSRTTPAKYIREDWAAEHEWDIPSGDEDGF